MSDNTTRRRFLAVTATTGIASLAGCLGSGGGGGGDGTGTATSTSDEMMKSGTPTGDTMEPTEFTVTVKNVSTKRTLKTSDGSVPVPLAPVAWAVHEGSNPLFTKGEQASAGLETLAEDGGPKKLVKEVKPNVAKAGAAAVAVDADGPGPIGPGGAYRFTVEAHAGQRLSIASMFVQSNDLFYAPGTKGMPLFDGDKPVSRDVTSMLTLWDAGTEKNQPPGEGADQAPRQSSKDTGPDENGTVRPISAVDDGYTYPDKTEVIKVKVAPGMDDG